MDCKLHSTFIGISNILTTLATLRNVNGIRQNKQGVARKSVVYAASLKKFSFTVYYTGGIFFNLLLEFCETSCINPLITVPRCNIILNRKLLVPEKYLFIHIICISLVTSTCRREIDRGVFYKPCCHKITELNFFPLPCKLGNSERFVVLACALPSIHGYNFKIVRQTVWQ